METVLTNAMHELTVEQIEFICKEFSMTKDQLFSAPENVLDDMYDGLCDIEMAEIDESYTISEYGRIAADIVTVLGNAIAASMGYLNEDG